MFPRANPKKVFISAPYTSEDGAVVKDRIEKLADYVSHLVKLGREVPIVPLAMGQFILDRCSEPTSSSFENWASFCVNYVNLADNFRILCLDGWDESAGIKEELRFWLEDKIGGNTTITFVNPDTYQTLALCDCECHTGDHVSMHFMECCDFSCDKVSIDLNNLSDLNVALQLRWRK